MVMSLLKRILTFVRTEKEETVELAGKKEENPLRRIKAWFSIPVPSGVGKSPNSDKEVTSRTDPRLGYGTNDTPVPQNEAYLVLPKEERQEFIRPVRRSYLHVGVPGKNIDTDCTQVGCGAKTYMAQAIAETCARKPSFYGATYCTGCNMHRPVGEFGEFIWDDGSGERVGT